MIVFLDCEYQGDKLISVGMIDECGQRELYIELEPPAVCSRFVTENVIPKLHGDFLTNEQFENALYFWLLNGPREITIACDDEKDLSLLTDRIPLPENVKRGRFNLRPLIDTSIYHNAVCKYHAERDTWHHALHDAKAHRAGWLAWMAKNKTR